MTDENSSIARGMNDGPVFTSKELDARNQLDQLIQAAVVVDSDAREAKRMLSEALYITDMLLVTYTRHVHRDVRWAIIANRHRIRAAMSALAIPLDYYEAMRADPNMNQPSHTRGPLIDHAVRELKLAGMYDIDADYGPGAIAGQVLDMIELFSAGEHSGGSHDYTLDLFTRLANFEPLSELTSEPDEWTDVSEAAGIPMWQNKRDGKAFSHDGGRTMYTLRMAVLRSEAARENVLEVSDDESR